MSTVHQSPQSHDSPPLHDTQPTEKIACPIRVPEFCAQDVLPSIGERIEQYKLTRELGRGGMGLVYQAWDEQLLRHVALKIVLPELAAHPGISSRVLQEARTAASISHDNVVTVYHVGEYRGTTYIAMKYLEGVTLARYLRKHPQRLELTQILRICREVASGLEAAHARGLVHRDIKPANIWLEAPRGRAILLDFGIARSMDAEIDPAMNGLAGTPEYMSPEQAHCSKLDHRSDLFSLGCLMYELLAGRPPYSHASKTKTLTALRSEHEVPIPPLDVSILASVRDLVSKLLNKDITQRPATATELVKQLKQLERDVLFNKRGILITDSEGRLNAIEAEPAIVIAEQTSRASTTLRPKQKQSKTRNSRPIRTRRKSSKNQTVKIGLAMLAVAALVFGILMTVLLLRGE